MVFSYYLYKLPYATVWHLLKVMRKLKPVVFYCGDPMDHYIFQPVMQYLGNIPYVTDKSDVRTFLKQQGIAYESLPAFPMVVVMARHSIHKFPCHSIIKIGMRHGAYHFKRMTSPESYNQFDRYLMTSKTDVQKGKEHGVTTACAIGFPKLDPVFRGDISEQILQETGIKARLNPQKPTVLFSSTYNASGMSAVHIWCNKLHLLTSEWNVLVTLHSWINSSYKSVIKKTPGVYFINEYNILPFLMLADVVVGDTSSFLAECCALDKPIITFTTNKARRSLGEIDEIIDAISYRIRSFGELPEMLTRALNNKSELKAARTWANRIFFDDLDGRAGERAADEIRRFLPVGK